MSALWHDLRLAARLLVRRPALTAIVVLSLGLAIGANTSIFSLVSTVLLSPLPYPEAQELVGVYRIDPDVTGPNPSAAGLGGLWAVPYEVHRDWIEMSPVFAAAGGYAPAGLTLQGDDGPSFVGGARVTSGVLEALGVAPRLGRALRPEDDQIGADPVAIVSHGFWQARLGGDPEILGRQLRLDGVAYSVIGVMPPGFAFPDQDYRLWISFSDDQKASPVRNSGYMQVLARLLPGLTLEQAQREMDQVAARIGELHPEEVEHGIGLFSQKELIVGDAGTGLLILMGAVALVLLIACANIASLFLVRAMERRREIGVRCALGASRKRLILGQMSESLLLSLLGGVAGWGLAVVGMKPFLALMPGELPRLDEISVDVRLLLIATGFALLTGLLTGFLPALRAAATPISSVIQEGGRNLAGGRSRSRTHAGLVVSQIALAFVLLAGAGLFIRSMFSILSVNPGFEAQGIAVARVTIPQDLPDWDAVDAYYRRVEERLRVLPGVEEVGAASQMPFVGGWSAPPVSIETSDGIQEGIRHFATVHPAYFTTMGLPVVAGRALSLDDRADTEPVVVISQAMAREIAPQGSPLGLRVRVDSAGDSIWRSVVGVVGDVRYRLHQGPTAMFYVPFAQRPTTLRNWVIRTSADPAGLVSPIRDAITVSNPEGATNVQILDDVIRTSGAVASSRFAGILLGSLACLAALLAVVGVYGVLAYLVQLRSREIGIQLALGAEQFRVLRAVLRQGMVMALLGLVIGTGMALALGRVVESQLFGVQPSDPLTLVFTAALMLVATLLGSYFPARRAAAVDPVEVLRGE